jgi:hypothetical protein
MKMWRVSDRTWNTAVGYAAAVVFAGITGFALGATFSNGCPMDPQNAPFGCAEFVLSRYQALIAAAFAAIALFPVWRQVLGAQTDIVRSAALRLRVKMISKVRDDLEKEIERLRAELRMYPDDITYINFWAHDTAQLVDRFLLFVSDQRALRLDGPRAAAARNDLTDKMERLSRALWVINWDVRSDEVDDLAEEEQVRLQAEAVEAEAKLEQTIDTALKMARNMSRAFFEDIADARTELRALDDGLMSRGQ